MGQLRSNPCSWASQYPVDFFTLRPMRSPPQLGRTPLGSHAAAATVAQASTYSQTTPPQPLTKLRPSGSPQEPLAL